MKTCRPTLATAAKCQLFAGRLAGSGELLGRRQFICVIFLQLGLDKLAVVVAWVIGIIVLSSQRSSFGMLEVNPKVAVDLHED